MRYLFTLAVTAMLGCSASADNRPNIVFILADDLGYTDLGVTGSDYYLTPNLDKFAGQSLTFTNGYANGANCAPTRAALMSGMYAPLTGVYTVAGPDRGESKDRALIPSPNKTKLDPQVITLAEVMRDAGYTTAMMGKWHLGDGEAGPKNQGFEIVPIYGHGARSFFAPYGRSPLPKDAPEGEYLTDRLANDAVTFLKTQQDADKPFFLYLPFFSVHAPIHPQPEFVEKAKARPKGKYHNQPKYAGFVESLDTYAGRVLDAIDELGLAGNTIVVFTSDNGGHHTYTDVHPLRGGKGTFYEGGIRVPLFVKYPGVTKAGTSFDEPVVLLDFFPTLAEIGKGELPKKQPVDGVSLLSVMRDPDASLGREAIYFHFPCYLQGYSGGEGAEAQRPPWRATPCSAIRMGDWKLIKYFETGDIELFNLNSDPGEKKNVVFEESDKSVELNAQLLEWLWTVNAPIPTEKNPKYKPK